MGRDDVSNYLNFTNRFNLVLYIYYIYHRHVNILHNEYTYIIIGYTILNILVYNII